MQTRRAFLGTAAAATALAAAPNVRRARAGSPLTIGYIADFPNASVLAIAEDQGYWDAEGLSPQTKVFTNGPIQIQAMGAGSLNFGTIGPGALWLPASGRAKVLGVNDIGFSDRIIAQGSVGSMADLKGRKIGVPQGTSGDMILRLGLRKAGMTVQDVQIVPMDPSTIVAAFTSKQIDAAGIWYPLIDTIRPRVPDMKELAANADFYPDTSFINTFVARNELVGEDPDTAKAFLRVMKKAIDWRAANLEKAIELTAAFLGAPVPVTANVARSRKLLTSAELNTATEDGTVAKWLGQFNDMFKTFGTLPNPLPPERFFDAKLYLSA